LKQQVREHAPIFFGSHVDGEQRARDSTPYLLCCWLRIHATRRQRRQFLRFVTCVLTAPRDGDRQIVRNWPNVRLD
jgi:hypothetical protein